MACQMCFMRGSTCQYQQAQQERSCLQLLTFVPGCVVLWQAGGGFRAKADLVHGRMDPSVLQDTE